MSKATDKQTGPKGQSNRSSGIAMPSAQLTKLPQSYSARHKQNVEASNMAVEMEPERMVFGRKDLREDLRESFFEFEGMILAKIDSLLQPLSDRPQETGNSLNQVIQTVDWHLN